MTGTDRLDAPGPLRACIDELRARWGLVTAVDGSPPSAAAWLSLPAGTIAEPVGEPRVIERRCPGYAGKVQHVALDTEPTACGG